AHHTRFEHSLGVSHLAGRMADSLSLSEEESTIVEVAAMLHDVGHGPYSHTLEHILHERGGADHMHITEGIITGDYEILSDEERSLFPERRTVPEILESYGIDPKEVSSLIHGPDAGGKERNLFHWGEGAEAFHSQDHTMSHLVHGPVDCDQMDYLLRDAHFTGVRHGIIDHHRLIHCMERHSGDIAISEGGLSALEGMMTARALMYSAVYFHKVTRITEVMLSRAVERSEENLPEAVQMQRMVDAEVWHALDSAGPFAKDMIKRLKYRQLLKNCLTKRMDELTPAQIDRLVHLATNSEDRIQVEDEIARRSGLDPGYVCIDVPSIKLLLSEPRMAAVDVRIIGKDGRTRWFREHTPVADALRKRQVSQNAMSVITLKGYEEAVANIAERIIYL
ncbi:MAG: HD domain-containing protein, partial [Candidatus Thermoplasmatota archaeon]|nr:HD domain-containing protein [Candidatus Thermoplasmatota archaeon]